MKTLRYLLCLSFLLTSTISFSQERSKSWMIKYDLISLLGDQVTNSMGVMLGLEFLSGENKSFEFDAMYIFPCSSCGNNYTSITTEKTNGFLLSAESRYYLIPENKYSPDSILDHKFFMSIPALLCKKPMMEV